MKYRILRLAMAAGSVLLLSLLFANLGLAGDVESGKAVYDKNCAACHGAAGVGASGPALKGSDFTKEFDTIDKIKAVIRKGTPKGMPPYNASQISDADLDNLVAYIQSLTSAAAQPTPLPVKGLQPTATAVATVVPPRPGDVGRGYVDPSVYVPPPGVQGGEDCAGCHATISPGAVKDFKLSKMFQKGVGCADCHGKHPDVKMPTPDTCGKCHNPQFTQHMAGKHGVGWDLHQGAARRLAQYPAMQEEGCGACHSIQKRCDSCHTRHVFSPKEAKEPRACATCHMGPDHSQYEYYESSKHGVIYNVEGKGWEEGGRVPTCVTCHMYKGTHDVSQGITLGGASQGKFVGNEDTGNKQVKDPGSGIMMNGITKATFDRERAKMLANCTLCHDRRFAEHKLGNADEIKRQSDSIAGEALKVIEGLYKDKLLDPMPENRPPNPLAGHTLVLTGQQLYEKTSQIEAMFFRMYKFDLIQAWKGAYHANPDYTHWYGNAPLKLDLDEIKGEASKLRRLAALESKSGPVAKPEVTPAPAKAAAAGLSPEQYYALGVAAVALFMGGAMVLLWWITGKRREG